LAASSLTYLVAPEHKGFVEKPKQMRDRRAKHVRMTALEPKFSVNAARHAELDQALYFLSRLFAAPLYRLDVKAICNHIVATYDQMLEQAQRNSQQFVWDTIRSSRNFTISTR
jgi:hypothetical protein